jgi:polyhydroxybutyrate depolymerase
MQGTTTAMMTILSCVALLVTQPASAAGGEDVQIDAGRGPVTLHLPPAYDHKTPLPLVVFLHGYGTDGGSHENNYFRMTPLSDDFGFLYTYPDGTVQEPTGLRFWNCDPPWFKSGVDDSGYLRDLIDLINAEFAVDAARVYVIGHSNGGCMAHRMACDHADAVAAVMSLAGWLPREDQVECVPSAPIHVLQIHGTNDESITYEMGCVLDEPPDECSGGAVEITERWAAFNGCAIEADESCPMAPRQPSRATSSAAPTAARRSSGRSMAASTYRRSPPSSGRRSSGSCSRTASDRRATSRGTAWLTSRMCCASSARGAAAATRATARRISIGAARSVSPIC